MTWTKGNNPSKRRRKPRKLDYTEASILAGKQMIIDSELGYKVDVKFYEEVANKMLGKGE